MKVNIVEKQKQNNNTKYGKEITKKLFKNYGTPFYPEDVNDEIY